MNLLPNHTASLLSHMLFFAFHQRRMLKNFISLLFCGRFSARSAKKVLASNGEEGNLGHVSHLMSCAFN
jgi:hypothetical protein